MAQLEAKEERPRKHDCEVSDELPLLHWRVAGAANLSSEALHVLPVGHEIDRQVDQTSGHEDIKTRAVIF